MNVLITRRAHRRCKRALATSLALVIATGVTAAAVAEPAPQRFRVQASVSPAPAAQSNDRLGLNARLVPAQKSLSGAGYVLNASVAASPSGCAGDTIFADGFDL